MTIRKKIFLMIARSRLDAFKETVEEVLASGEHEINDYLGGEHLSGYTLLHAVIWNPAATVEFKEDAIEFLKSKGANTSIKTKDGKTCRELAAKPKIAELFPPEAAPAPLGDAAKKAAFKEAVEIDQANIARAAASAAAAEEKTPIVTAIEQYKGAAKSDAFLAEIIHLLESGADTTGALTAAFGYQVITDIIEDATSPWALEVTGNVNEGADAAGADA